METQEIVVLAAVLVISFIRWIWGKFVESRSELSGEEEEEASGEWSSDVPEPLRRFFESLEEEPTPPPPVVVAEPARQVEESYQFEEVAEMDATPSWRVEQPRRTLLVEQVSQKWSDRSPRDSLYPPSRSSRRSRQVRSLLVGSDSLKNAIVLREILDKPLGLRERESFL